MNAIDVIDLEKKFKEFALQDISFALPRGCIMGFIGENGAGKSTTIKLMLELLHRDAGTITLLGESNIGANPTVKEDIGVVFDEACFSDMLKTPDVNLICKNLYKNWDEAVFNGYTKRFDLSPTKQIKSYSRGMKMKLSIAVALSHHAKLLILDEATSGLDPIARDEILDVFLEFIQNAENSIFISSHIISDLEKICDYITFIHKGKIKFSERKDDLLAKYGVLKCTVDDLAKLDKAHIHGVRKNSFGVEALVTKAPLAGSGLLIDRASLEDIMLYIVKGEAV